MRRTTPERRPAHRQHGPRIRGPSEAARTLTGDDDLAVQAEAAFRPVCGASASQPISRRKARSTSGETNGRSDALTVDGAAVGRPAIWFCCIRVDAEGENLSPSPQNFQQAGRLVGANRGWRAIKADPSVQTARPHQGVSPRYATVICSSSAESVRSSASQSTANNHPMTSLPARTSSAGETDAVSAVLSTVPDNPSGVRRRIASGCPLFEPGSLCARQDRNRRKSGLGDSGGEIAPPGAVSETGLLMLFRVGPQGYSVLGGALARSRSGECRIKQSSRPRPESRHCLPNLSSACKKTAPAVEREEWLGNSLSISAAIMHHGAVSWRDYLQL